MTAAAYLRVSTSRQESDGFSLDAQQRAVIERGADPSLVFSDAATGSTDQRPGFQAMLAAAHDGAFDLLLVWKLSRFGRSTEDTLRNLRLLDEAGVEVQFIEDGISTSGSASRLVTTMLSAVAEMERENIRAQSKMGMVESASQGCWQGGVPPFGTKIGSAGRLEQDGEAADTLRMAISMILAGNSTAEASETLNAQGRRPPRSPVWKSSELRRHLRRPHLKGEMMWDGIAIPTPPIIDPATWDRLQRVLDSSDLPKRRDRQNSDAWPLSQRVACSCGGYLIGVGRRRGIRYYRCSNHYGDAKRLCSCDHDGSPGRPRWWKADDLDSVAWEQLVLILSDREKLEAAIDRVLGRAVNGQVDPDVLRRLRRRVASLETGLVHARADVFEAGDNERDLATRTAVTLAERLRSARDELDRIERAAEDQQRTEERIVQWITFAEDRSFRFGPRPDPSEMKRVFADLDVRGRIRTSAERDEIIRGLPKPRRQDTRTIRFHRAPSYLRIESFYIDDGAASRSPTTTGSARRFDG